MGIGAFLTLTATVLGGLAVFVYGMKLMTAGLQALAGSRMRDLLNRLTRHRVSGLMVGSLTGFLVHSGAGTIMMVGFVNAGLLTLVASVPVMLGNNLGTTLSMQVISLQIGKYAWGVMALGMLLHLVFWRRTALKTGGLMLFAFGLIFLGMDTMKDAIIPLKDAGYFAGLLAHTDAGSLRGMLVGLAASTLVTALMQSSGATIGMLFALSAAGVFTDLRHAFPLVLGAHIGTCSATLLGSLGTNLEARRSALAHLVFNLLGGLAAALAAPLYLWLIPLAGGDLVRQIANAHTLVQLVNALVVLPLSVPFARLVTRLVPGRGQGDEERSHLDDRFLDTPEMAIVAVLQETRRMACMARRMVRGSMEGLLKHTDQPFEVVARAEESVDLLKDSINEFLVLIAKHELSRRQAVMLQFLMQAVANIERVGDHAESLTETTREKRERRVWFDDESMSLLVELYKRLDRVLELTTASLDPGREQFEECAEQVMGARDDYYQLSAMLRERYTRRVLAKEDDALNGIFYSRYVDAFDKIVGHSTGIALLERDPLFRLKPYKLTRRSERRPTRPDLHLPGIPVDESLFKD